MRLLFLTLLLCVAVTAVVAVQSGSNKLPKKPSRKDVVKPSKVTKLPNALNLSFKHRTRSSPRPKPIWLTSPSPTSTRHPKIDVKYPSRRTKVPGKISTKRPRVKPTKVPVKGSSVKDKGSSTKPIHPKTKRPPFIYVKPNGSTVKLIPKIVTRKPIVDTTTTNILQKTTPGPKLEPFPEADPLKKSSKTSISTLQREAHL
uniref:Extensin-like n=1 Tax=Panagrellus redivivus TaxID=6233 RepID=A0A7E4V1V4_PANRE